MNTAFHLTGKRILVTGASSGIGRECCIQIAAMGGTVVAGGRNEERLAETLTLLTGTGHSSVRGDLNELVESKKLVDILPVINGVVHSAGITKILPAKFIDAAALHAMQRINYEAPVLLTTQLLKHRKLSPGSSLVFIASTASFNGAKAHALYAASKGALVSFVRVLALEAAAQKIRVNAVSPAMVRTPLMNSDVSISSEMMQEYEKLYPLGFGRPADVAAAVIYLLSPASRWVTGSNMILDGGFTIG